MKNITTYLILIWTLLATWACKPVKDGYGLDDPGQYSSVYIAAAFGGVQNITANTAEPLNIEIYANYSGVIALSEDLYVFMEADPDRVDEYNTENGTSFPALPTSHFTVEKNHSIISPGNTTAKAPALIGLNTGAFADGDTYLLPVSIVSVNKPSITINKSNRTVYLGIKCLAGSFTITTDPLSDYGVSDTEEW